MAFQSKTGARQRVGTCIVENGANLWKAAWMANWLRATSRYVGRTLSEARVKGSERQKKGAAVENCLWMGLILCDARGGSILGFRPIWDLGWAMFHVERLHLWRDCELDLDCSMFHVEQHGGLHMNAPRGCGQGQFPRVSHTKSTKFVDGFPTVSLMVNDLFPFLRS